MKLELEEIEALIDKVKDAALTEFVYQDEEIRLKIRNRKARPARGDERCCEAQRAGQAPGKEAGEIAQKEPPGASPAREGDVRIDSPMVGTFYAGASEKAEPFVKVGDAVQPGQTVGIVEAMKLMNEIEAECAGTVVEILAGNGQMVEYGQPLFYIRPSAP